jgi:hypothetical protein
LIKVIQKKPGEQVCNSYSNCLKTPGRHASMWVKTTKVEDEIGGNVTVGIHVPEIAKTSAEASTQCASTPSRWWRSDPRLWLGLDADPAQVRGFPRAR